jgi:hypothetical protein
LFLSGRYDVNAPRIERDRGDPLRQDNLATVETLALASGLEVLDFGYRLYTDHGYRTDVNHEANAYMATLTKGLSGMPFEKAYRHYRMGEVEGWMSEEELGWLYETARALGGGTVVEVGSFMGRSSCAILGGLREGRGGRLVCVDLWSGKGTVREAEVAANGGPEWLKGKLVANVQSRSLALPIVAMGQSHECAEDFEDEKLAWVFIDGCHEQEQVYTDIIAWSRKVETGGIISGHDYDRLEWPGVWHAVNEVFAGELIAKPAGSIWAVRV